MSLVPTSKFAGAAKAEQAVLAAQATAAFSAVTHLRLNNMLTVDEGVAKTLISNESFSTVQAQTATDMMDGLTVSIESFFKNIVGNVNGKPISAQQSQAMAYALASAMNPRAHLTRMFDKAQHNVGPLSVLVPDHSGIDPTKLGTKTLEAYDTKPNDQTLDYTASFALATATQNKFGEMFYKTVNLSPDQYAVTMEIPLISVHDEVRHELEIRLLDFQRRNIVNAEIDHTILKNDTLRIYPVYREQTKDAFLDQTLLAASEVMTDDGVKVLTAPLRTNHRASLLRLAQTDAQLAKGVYNQTDALDPVARLEAVYLLVKSDDGLKKEIIRISTANSPMNFFVEASQGLTRKMDLNFTTDNVCLSNVVKLANNGDVTTLPELQGPTGLNAFLSFSVRGDINLQDSSYEVITGSVVANTVKDAAGKTLPLDGAQEALVKRLNNITVVGIDIDARMVNSNLRELGQLADFNTYRQIYGVSLGSPLSVQRPIMNGDGQDALHAAALSYMCRVRQSNKAVTTLLGEVESLRAYKKRTDVIGRQPEIMGISSYLVEPVLIEEEIDLDKEVTTTAQHQRYADVTSILTDTCTIVSYKLWQMSNWQAAANLLEGTEAQPPVVKLGTDMVLTQYLKIDGDTRTVGPDFTYEKGWSPDARVRDKIFIALGYPNSTPGVPHPLDKGMMLNKPEVVAALNLSRGSHSRELIVHPSFRHIPLCPILGVVTVKNLQKALTKKATLGIEVTNAADFPKP